MHESPSPVALLSDFFYWSNFVDQNLLLNIQRITVPSHPPPGMKKLLILMLVFLSSFLESASSDPANPKIGDCVPVSCGDVDDISYPFWVNGKQQPFYGFPQFELQCDDNKKEVSLEIGGYGEYIVRNIFHDNQSLIVTAANTDAACPLPHHNITSFDYTSFNVSSANKQLRFFSNCTVPPPSEFSRVPCAGDDMTFAFLAATVDYTAAAAAAAAWMLMANGCVPWTIPVLGYTGVADGSSSSSNYLQLVKNGFLLDWSVANCTDCKNSNGECGYNLDRKTFMCICSDGTHSRSCKNSKWRVIAIGVGVGGGLLVLCVLFFLWYRRRRVRQRSSTSSKFLIRPGSSELNKAPSMKDPEEGSIGYHTHVFSYAELHEATNGFDASRELGDGGFGTVYKGQLKDGRIVAVKRLYENNFKRVEQFLNEVAILSQLRHKNLVTLYGCTSRHSRELLLVYEFVPNGTVADHLHGPRAPEGALKWPLRLNIAIQTAEALAYLHATEPQIIHRDVKTTNILLDEGFHVKVADFGLSRLFPIDATHVSTLPQGTPGYVDPEYHQCYQLTDKSDVYSFGVVLVELISSMPAVDITRHRHEINLANLAINKIQSREVGQLVDPVLMNEADWETERMITTVAELAFRCLQAERDMRPSIKEVMEELKRIQSSGAEKDGGMEADVQTSDDTRLLKNNVVPFSPDSVTMRWESTKTTPNTSA